MWLPGTIGYRGRVFNPPPPSGSVNYVPVTPTAASTDYARPQAGAEFWYNAFQCSIPNNPGVDRYIRFSWAGLNPTNGGYNWSAFDTQINTAIDNNQGFSFGIMTQYPFSDPGAVGLATFGGGRSAYPEWCHNIMQGEATKDYLFDGDWVPNWNSTNGYLNPFNTFLQALNAHLNSTFRSGKLYANAINWIDIRGYGGFGEWHSYPWGFDAGAGNLTAASANAIIDMHKTALPNFALVSMISTYDVGGFWSPASQLADKSWCLKGLTDSNNVGQYGIRRDNWGATETYYNAGVWQSNPGTWSGQSFSTLIMNKYKFAAITGEPCCNSGYTALPSQVTLYHATSFGNGNYGAVTCSAITTASQNSGYRIRITGGSAPNQMPFSGSFHISLDWRNVGLTPIYKNWTVTYELRTGGGAVAWTGAGSMNLKLFLPSGSSTTVLDNFNLSGSVPNGTYSLHVIVKDPLNYRTPLPLDITGRTASGSYVIVNTVVVS